MQKQTHASPLLISNEYPDLSTEPPDNPTSTDNSKYTPKGIPLEKIIEYRRKGLSARAIGKIFNCDHSNVINRLKTVAEDVDTLPEYMIHKADILTLTGKRIINHLTDDKLQKASAYQLTGMYGIINQHDRLERDLSTANTMTVIADLEAVRKERERLANET